MTINLSKKKVVFISATPFGALYGAETEYEEVTDPLTGVTVKVPKKK